MSTRVKSEQSVYDQISFDPISGEMEVWDRVVFPAVVRKRQLALLRAFLDNRASGIGLDVGCGAGWTTHLLSHEGKEAIGIDVSRALVQGAKGFQGANEEYIIADGGTLPLRDKTIDLIVSASALHHLPPEKALREWGRVVRPPAGRLILFEPNSLNPLAAVGRRLFPLETHTEDERPFNPEQLRSLLLSTGWEVLQWETQILFAFAVSRMLRIIHVPDQLAWALVPLIEGMESLARRAPIANRLGWVIGCVAKRCQ